MRLVPTALVTVFLLCGCCSCGQQVITVDGQNWTYLNGMCTVTFKLRNHSSQEVERNVSIVAHWWRDTSGKGSVVDDIIGEKDIAVRLRPYEEKELTETLVLFPSRRPTMVLVTPYKGR